MLDLINEVVDNKYRITEFVNHGTFGSVYKAEREVLGQGKAGLVAVKLLRDRLADEAILMNEVKTLQRCQHPNVISCHGAGKNHLGSKLAGRFFIAMELADESLAQRLERGPLSVDEARALTADLCAGLTHLHAGQLVHRDLKPANVLRVGSTWKLSDFGLARESGYLRTASRHPGTPAYSPPEAESDTLESSFDMWSLGCVLHECLTGRLPTSPSQPRTPVIDASIPAPFQAIITGCLLQDPKRRLTAEQCLNQADPNATPLHNLPSFAFDTCFVCEPGNDCARPLLSGRIGDMRRVPDGFTCMVYAADELEGRTLLLTETWAVELGERLFDVWPTLSKRKNGVSVSAFHLFAHGTGFVANDKSLVVLDPDWLVNVTALSNVHDCERVKLVKRYEATDISNHLVVGNVVNDLFPDIWNRNDVGEARQTEEIGVQLVPLAQSGYEDVMALRATVDKHVSRLRQWADPKPRNSTLNTETYVIAPQLGLKGRIDALWFKGDTPVVLAELKTGRQRATDELQVLSYGLMLVSRGETHRDIHTLLLHSKPDLDQVMTTVKLDAPAFRRAVALRNKVLLVDGATDAPFNERWCGTCYKQTRATCTLLTHLSEHHDTRPEGLRKRYAANEPRVAALTADVRAFFKRHEADLLEELRAVKSQQAWLWSRTSEEREREGLALRFKSITPLEQRKNGHRYHLEAMGPDGNQSLFRIDDRVIVSGPEGPTTGRLVSAFINASPLDGLEISCDEPLPFENGGWVNFDGDEKLVEREFAALFQFVVRPAPMRDVVVNSRTPTIAPPAPGYAPPSNERLNALQQKAVELSLRTSDYMLVLGPPGAGKTTLLRAMIRAHVDAGRRVLVSAQTNRAVDQVVRKLIEGGMQSQVLRLGRTAAIADDVQACVLDRLYDRAAPLEQKLETIKRLCAERSVIAATASMLAKGEYQPMLGEIDLVIIDEATQLSVPMSLAPLRYGKRFVLVGDPKQLAPIRLVDPSSDGVTRESGSLFEVLERKAAAAGSEGLVVLEEQYRMNDAICAVPSRMWYDAKLRPHDDVAGERHDIAHHTVEEDLRDILDPHRPIVFVDVPPHFKGARTNVREAEWVGRIARALVDADARLRDPREAERRIGVLAPFRAQVAGIRRELAQRLPDIANTRSWVDTVDRFQGDERDVMIISLVGANGGDVPELLQDPRRLNVALSRARHKLVLVGDHASLARNAMFAALFAVMGEEVPDYRVCPEA